MNSIKNFRSYVKAPDLSYYITIASIFFLILIIFSCTTNTIIRSEEEKEHEMILNHKVKTIKLFQTDYKNGIAQKEYLSQIKQFNKKGNKTEETNYNNQGKIISVIHYMYDSKGNLVLSAAKSADSNFIFRETRSYNKDNKRSELVFYLPDGTYKYRNVSTYNTAGYLQQLAWYWPSGLRATNNYSYKGGFRVEDTEYDAKGKFNYMWIFSYDASGNQTNAIQYYPGNVISAKIISSYNPDNRLVKQVDYSGLSIRKQTFINYMPNGLIDNIAEVSPGGFITSKIRYQYETYSDQP